MKMVQRHSKEFCGRERVWPIGKDFDNKSEKFKNLLNRVIFSEPFSSKNALQVKIWKLQLLFKCAPYKRLIFFK